MKSQTKIIIRRLPKCLTKEEFLSAIHPYKKFNYFRFCNADKSYKDLSSSRAYIDFYSEEDMYQFKNEFDCKLFVDSEGNESYGLIEFAVFQKISGINKQDIKQNTMSSDPDYIKFVQEINDIPTPDGIGTVESNLEEIKNRHTEMLNTITPLVEYINNLPKRGRKDDYRRKNDNKKFISNNGPDNIIEYKTEINSIQKNTSKDTIMNSKSNSIHVPGKFDGKKNIAPKRNDINTYAAKYEEYSKDNNGYVDDRTPKQGYENRYPRGGGDTRRGTYGSTGESQSSYYNNKPRNDSGSYYGRSYNQDTNGYQTQQDYSQGSRPPTKTKRGGGRRPPSYSATRKD